MSLNSERLKSTNEVPGTPWRHLLAVAAQAAIVPFSNGMASAPKLLTASTKSFVPYEAQSSEISDNSFNRPVVVS